MSNLGERHQLIGSKYLEYLKVSFTSIAKALKFLRPIVGEILNRYKQTLIVKMAEGNK